MAYDYNEYIRKYNKENIVFISLKLNRKTDSDIIEALNGSKSKQGKVKELIRIALQK